MLLRNLAAAALGLLFAFPASGAEYLVYAAGQGIHGYRFETRNARLKPLGLLARLSHPAFLLEHPDHRYLYAASEPAGGSVSAFLIDPRSGKLSLVNQVFARIDGPCHLALDREGRWLAVANCAGRSVAIFPLRKDGGLGDPLAFVQPSGAASRPSGVLFSPDNRFLLVADSGLDRIFVYRFSVETGALTPADPPSVPAVPEAGVRRLAFHPNGRVLYAANPKRPGVTAYRYDPNNGELTHLQQTFAQAPAGAAPDPAAEIAVNPAGSLLYASLATLDSMALFLIDPVRFTLSPFEITPLVGRMPGHFAFDPTGAYLLVAGRDSRDLTVYSVHLHTGQLRPAGRPVSLDQPACVVFVLK